MVGEEGINKKEKNIGDGLRIGCGVDIENCNYCRLQHNVDRKKEKEEHSSLGFMK